MFNIDDKATNKSLDQIQSESIKNVALMRYSINATVIWWIIIRKLSNVYGAWWTDCRRPTAMPHNRN